MKKPMLVAFVVVLSLTALPLMFDGLFKLISVLSQVVFGLVLIVGLLYFLKNKFVNLPDYALTKDEKAKLYGRMGEEHVRRVLSRLGPEYWVFHDVTLPSNETKSGTTQIDHMVVSKYGIFVIETKNYGGMIIGHSYEKEWVQKIGRQTHTFFSPVYQNRLHANAAELLLPRQGIPVFSVIAFASRTNISKINVPDTNVAVTTIPRLVNAIEQVSLRYLTDEEVLEYANSIREIVVEKETMKKEVHKEELTLQT